MSHQWHYSQQGKQHGPVSQDQLKQLAASGKLQSGDMVWHEGMDQWAQANTVPDLFPAESQAAPPPLPPVARSNGPGIGSAVIDSMKQVGHKAGGTITNNHQLIWAYRATLGLLFVALLCPWIAAKSSVSIRYGDMARDMNDSGFGEFGGQQFQGMANQSESMSLKVSGVSTLWGKAILLLVLAGGVLSFVGPKKVVPRGKDLFSNQEKAIMAGVGGLSMLLMLFVFFSASSYVNQEVAVASQYSSTSASASLAWGWYIGFIVALGTSAFGFLANWQEN